MLDLIAPKDPTDKRKGFYVLLDQQVGGIPQPDGAGRHPVFASPDRLPTLAKLNGGMEDSAVLELLTTAKGFRQLVHSVGVSASASDPAMEIRFTLVFRGLEESSFGFTLRADGIERVMSMEEFPWKGTEQTPGEFLFQLPTDQDVASVTVKFYVPDGYDVPDNDPDGKVDIESVPYQQMIARSFLSGGNNCRVKRVLEKLRGGKPVTVAFLGGSITQGAGAVPIQANCYARKTFEAICRRYGVSDGQVAYIKAGVGGTPSQLGLLRYDRDITRDGAVHPDLVVVEFAVNDASDETNGVCYESLIRRILDQPNQPAVILLFSVFANDWNLKERLAPVGWRYQLPMVDVLEAVSPQFSLRRGEGLVITKRQYFYDVYHPSNLGHQVMTDCLMYLLDRLDRQQPMEDWETVIPPVYGTDWSGIRLLDRKDSYDGASVSPGSFCLQDADLQIVPLDDRRENTPEFPYNWQKGPGTEPFVLEIDCSALQLIFKDSGNASFGEARVSVDGVPVRSLDPREAGWTHCHATVLFQNEDTGRHRVEVSMAAGSEDKTFTILGFGYVP